MKKLMIGACALVGVVGSACANSGELVAQMQAIGATVNSGMSAAVTIVASIVGAALAIWGIRWMVRKGKAASSAGA